MRFRLDAPSTGPLDPIAEARGLALNRVSRKETSAREISEYLRKKGVEPDLVERLVRELIADHLVDDDRYARMMIRHQALRGKGPAYIQAKLRDKGIALDNRTIAALQGELTGTSELESAISVVRRHYANAADDKIAAARAYRALLRRGFTGEIARQAINSSATSIKPH
jgi:regulatory protein